MNSSPPGQEMDELIVEGLVVTTDADHNANIAPMGPRVDRDITRMLLRPFQTAVTYGNLAKSGCGVFHITDDVELLARAAVGQIDPAPRLEEIADFPCPRLADACRYFAFRVDAIDDRAERSSISCRIVARGELRPFLGFNRAKHAVLEAAILATRTGILPSEQILAELERLEIMVEKTAGEQEKRAFDFLQQWVDDRLRI